MKAGLQQVIHLKIWTCFGCIFLGFVLIRRLSDKKNPKKKSFFSVACKYLYLSKNHNLLRYLNIFSTRLACVVINSERFCIYFIIDSVRVLTGKRFIRNIKRLAYLCVISKNLRSISVAYFSFNGYHRKFSNITHGVHWEKTFWFFLCYFLHTINLIHVYHCFRTSLTEDSRLILIKRKTCKKSIVTLWIFWKI